MSGPLTSRALTGLASPLRVRVVLAGLAAALGAAAVLLGGVTWLARLGGWRSPAWVLAAWLLVA
ncbi:MAG: hypothetical protein ACRENB_06075, partial [Gemmatimonadales bacterium]